LTRSWDVSHTLRLKHSRTMRARLLTAFLLCISLSLTSLHAMEYTPVDDYPSDDDNGSVYVMSDDGFEYESDEDDYNEKVKEMETIEWNIFQRNQKDFAEASQNLRTYECQIKELDGLLISEAKEEVAEVIDYGNAPSEAVAEQDDAPPLSDEEIARRLQEEDLQQPVRAADRTYNDRLIGGPETNWVLPWAAYGCLHPQTNAEVDPTHLLLSWPHLRPQDRKDLQAACIKRLEIKRVDAEEQIKGFKEKVEQLEDKINRYLARQSAEQSTTEATQQEKLSQMEGEAEAKKLEDRRTDEQVRAQQNSDCREKEDCQETMAEAAGKGQRESSQASENADSGHSQKKKAEEVEDPERQSPEDKKAEMMKMRRAFLDRLQVGKPTQFNG